ncbi:NUDIX hydrolase [Caballeronia novacaledonica]|uniref:Uncharacterized protein n=1 Tax=Caballeronia novacaledonica TaxID=1544861 RepID=A0AA37IPL8_9BURK|nr:hypothetical protein [Caballeronia novacaledonica]GJH30230.1 hypothetical protein CBA19CS42_36960 [Caballeronia novacaledonica]
MQAAYAGLFGEGKFKQQVDHLVSKVAKDSSGKHVASGLHTFANIGPLPAKANRDKSSYFDPEFERSQRPANRFPGGAFDPEPTLEEAAYFELVAEEYGIPVEESLRHLMDYLDRLARAYEQHIGRTFNVEIPVDPAWYGCRSMPEREPLSIGLRINEDSDERIVQAFLSRLIENE